MGGGGRLFLMFMRGRGILRMGLLGKGWRRRREISWAWVYRFLVIVVVVGRVRAMRDVFGRWLRILRSPFMFTYLPKVGFLGFDVRLSITLELLFSTYRFFSPSAPLRLLPSHLQPLSQFFLIGLLENRIKWRSSNGYSDLAIDVRIYGALQ